jgi:hypothetical protein
MLRRTLPVSPLRHEFSEQDAARETAPQKPSRVGQTTGFTSRSNWSLRDGLTSKTGML